MNNETYSSLSLQRPTYGLTGSHLQPQKPKTLTGVYVIAGFNLLAFVASFSDTSQTSLAYTIAMLMELLVALGLIMRVNAARAIMVFLASVTILLSVVSAALLVSVQHHITTSKASYNAAIKTIDATDLTSSEQAQLSQLKATMTSAENKAGKAIVFTYTMLGIYVTESVVVMVYLSRPSIKNSFTS